VLRGGEESEEESEDVSELSRSVCFSNSSGIEDGAEMTEAAGVDASGLAVRERVAREADTEGWRRDSLADRNCSGAVRVLADSKNGV
jgi:hypothetical protein